jgi:chemotaxis protein CheC
MNLTPMQVDALTEVINIGVGRASGILNDMLRAHILLSVPTIRVFAYGELKNEINGMSDQNSALVQMKFKGPFSGTATLVFPSESASKLVDMVVGELSATSDMDTIRIGTLTEVGNIVLNGVIGSLANMLKLKVNYSIPAYQDNNLVSMISGASSGNNNVILMAHTNFKVESQLIEGNIILIFEVGTFENLLSAIDTYFGLQ